MCVGETISLPWFSKELKNDLLKNNCLLVRESIFIGWGSSFPIVLVPKYKLSLCYTPIKLDLLGFSGIGVFAWPRDHEVRIIWYQSLAPLIRLYPSEILDSCCFCKKSLVSNFFFSWFCSISKNKKNSYFILLLSKIYQ